MGRGEIPMRAEPSPVRAVVFHIKGAPRRFFLSYDRPTYNGAAISRLDERSFIMDKELQALLYQQWSNGACRGYVIWAMENCGFSPDDIQQVVSELYYVFDMKSIDEADKHYCNSPY